MLKIDIKPSKQLIVLMLIILMGSEILLAFLPMPLGIKIALFVITLVYGLRVLLIHGFLRHPKSIISLKKTEDDWQLIDREGSNFSATILGSSTVTTKVCVLRFAMLGTRSKQNLVIFKDSVAGDQYRELLVSARE